MDKAPTRAFSWLKAPTSAKDTIECLDRMGTFNKEKALVGAFSIIIKLRRRFVSSSSRHAAQKWLLLTGQQTD